MQTCFAVKECGVLTHYDPAKGACVQDCSLGSFVRMGVVGMHGWLQIDADIALNSN